MNLRLVLAATLFLPACFATVPPGEKGLVWRPFSSGLDPVPVDPGTYAVAPWNDIRLYSLQLQTFHESVVVLTKDELKIEITAAAILHPDPSRLLELEQRIGPGYYENVVRPKFRTAIRHVLADYTMIVISRNMKPIETSFGKELVERLAGIPIVVHDVIVEDIKFSQPVLAAIEKKLAKEQELEQRGFEVDIARKDAEIRVVEAQADADAALRRAKAQAEAQTIIQGTLTPAYLQYKALESPNAKYFYLPAGRDGLPVMITTPGEK